MFHVNSTMFVSNENYSNTEISLTKIREKIQQKDRKPVFALSYHNGFKLFDFSQIDMCDEKTIPIGTRLHKLRFRDPYKREYILEVDKGQKIYTKNRGYIPVEKISFLDVFYNYEGRLSRLVSNDELETCVEIKMYNVGVLYNNSGFINGILCRT